MQIKTWWGYTRYMIVKNNTVIGVLWQKVDLNKVSFGETAGWRIPLIYNGTVVGFVFS